MNLPDPMTVEEGLQTLERLGQAVEVAKGALQTGPWRPSDENPQEVWGYPAHMVIGGHFVILDLERLQKAGLPYQDRITQLEAACAAMREMLLLIRNDTRFSLGVTTGRLEPERDGPWVCIDHKRIDDTLTDDGKSLLDKATLYDAAQKTLDGRLGDDPKSVVWACEEYVAAEDELPEEFDSEDYRLSKAVKSLAETTARLQAVEKQAKEDKEYIEDLCAQLCKMEDALGFKNDCTDRDGAFVPTIGPWLERVRDLIAAEGEIGDLKDRLKALENQLAVAENLLLNAAPNPRFLTMGFQEKWSNEFGKWWAIRKADQTLQPAQKEQQ